MAQGPLSSDFDQRIEKGMKDWKIPGLAVAIVKDGKVFYSQGFGEKKLGSGDKVNTQTLFGIASVSKNITAAALAILVDEGKITWDTKIVDVIPWFALHDPWVTQQVTVRDVLTHQVGVGRILGNRLQFLSGHSRDELIYQMRYLEFEQPFRSSFVYSNLMYSVAGQVIEYVTGKTWDEFLMERIFTPLDMQSNTSILHLNDQSNAAWPHQEIEGKVVPIARRNWDNASPAGGINASVDDMAKWLILQLGNVGEYEGKRIVSERQMAEIHKPQVIRSSSGNPYGSQLSYGLGWNILDYQGKRVLTHGGATDGFNTAAYLMPELELGIIVVGNNFNQLGDAIAYAVMDSFLGTNQRDWFEQYVNQYNRSYANALKMRKELEATQVKNTQMTLDASEYEGVYVSNLYDTLEVTQSEKGLRIQLWNSDEVVADLEHWHYDTFRAIWKNRAMREEFISFSLGKDGKIEYAEIEFVLRPVLLQVGAYPSNYTRLGRFNKLID